MFSQPGGCEPAGRYFLKYGKIRRLRCSFKASSRASASEVTLGRSILNEANRSFCHSERGRLGLDGGPSANLRRRSRLLHRFLPRSSLNYSHCHRRVGFWARGGAGSDLRPIAGPAGPGERESDSGGSSERECKADDGSCCGPYRVCDAAFWGIGRFRAVADLSEYNLGRATEAWAGHSPHHPGSNPLLRLYLGSWLPALGFPFSHSSYRSCGTVV